MSHTFPISHAQPFIAKAGIKTPAPLKEHPVMANVLTGKMVNFPNSMIHEHRKNFKNMRVDQKLAHCKSEFIIRAESGKDPYGSIKSWLDKTLKSIPKDKKTKDMAAHILYRDAQDLGKKYTGPREQTHLAKSYKEALANFHPAFYINTADPNLASDAMTYFTPEALTNLIDAASTHTSGVKKEAAIKFLSDVTPKLKTAFEKKRSQHTAIYAEKERKLYLQASDVLNHWRGQ